MFGHGGWVDEEPLGGVAVELPVAGGLVVELGAELPPAELPDALELLEVVVDDGVAAPDINDPMPSPNPSVPAPTPIARSALP